MIHGFYSKLVRLEAEVVEEIVQYYNEFLFQTGAIRSLLSQVMTLFCQGFYSKLVRLEVHLLYHFAINKAVSIPNWCD